jgi:hypothetical protein
MITMILAARGGAGLLLCRHRPHCAAGQRSHHLLLRASRRSFVLRRLLDGRTRSHVDVAALAGLLRRHRCRGSCNSHRPFQSGPGVLRSSSEWSHSQIDGQRQETCRRRHRQHLRRKRRFEGWIDIQQAGLQFQSISVDLFRSKDRQLSERIPGIRSRKSIRRSEGFAWKRNLSSIPLKAPDSVVAKSKTTPARSRPLCAYPAHAQYNGTGDPQQAASFSCRE